MKRLLVVMGVCFSALNASADAAETISYTYDTHGRLVNVARSGSINNGLNTTTQFDRVDNRISYSTTGARRSSSAAIVMPIGGYTVIPLMSP